MTSKALKYEENKGFKRKKETQVTVKESETTQCSLPTDTSPVRSDSSEIGDLEAVIKDLSKEINLIFAKFAKVLSERSAVDASYVQEFDEILKEAKCLEIHLKQKRENLRNRLTMIANTLQRSNC
ncbi:testis-expressed protein 12 [Spea bombifrons]|uniref:testis-expressed protein 12 n=1 Tax=Spea bombifrons TaxID=233779 RepID=UPI0023495D3C|nr:testis-expressed protein 12 [Spea bombifrons]